MPKPGVEVLNLYRYKDTEMFRIVIDNIAMSLPFKCESEMDGKPIQVNGITFFPRYKGERVLRYESQIKNLHLHLYADHICCINSLHKFYLGNNFSDFHLSDIHKAINKLNDCTGMNWYEAVIKKIEIGCNVPANANSVYQGLMSYKTKDFAPMIWKGKVYGKSCEFDHYKVKVYNKQLQTFLADRASIGNPLLRYEVAITNPKYFTRYAQALPITLKQLLQKNFIRMMARDAVNIYQKTLKMQRINLSALTAKEKKTLAAMLHPLIREDLRVHNKSTYKRDRKVMKKIMQDQVFLNDDPGLLIQEKFEDLIESKIPTCNIPVKQVASDPLLN